MQCLRRSAALAVLLIAGFAVGAAHAADATGQYFTGGGVGSTECPTFVADMEQAKATGIGSLNYARTMHGYTMFVAGFQSAYNMQTPATCDIFPKISINQALAWVDNYCRKEPLKTFASGVAELAYSQHSARKQSCR